MFSSPLNDTLKHVQERLQKIRSHLALSDQHFSTMLNLDFEEYEDVTQGRAEIRFESLKNLCDVLDLDLSLLMKGDLDYRVLAKRYHSDQVVLPERYDVPEQKLSKARSIQTIYSSLVAVRGTAYANKVFARFQVSPKSFTTSNEFVSLLLIRDILSSLKGQGFSSEQVRFIGTMATGVNKGNELGLALSKSKSERDLYRAMHEELMHFFDHNWQYHLVELSDDHCVVEVVNLEKTMEAFKTKNVGSREVCLCRQGIYMSVLGHLNGKLAKLTELDCAFTSGGQRCVYRLDWR